jgi:hypothetical protein
MTTQRAKEMTTKPEAAPEKKPEEIARWENEGGAIRPTGGLAAERQRIDHKRRWPGGTYGNLPERETSSDA